MEASRSPRPKKVRPRQCAVKVMFIVAYDIDGVILQHAVPPRQTVNAAVLLHVPAAPPSSNAQEKTILGEKNNPIILHEKARSHTATVVTDLLRRWKWGILQHARYLSQVSPAIKNSSPN